MGQAPIIHYMPTCSNPLALTFAVDTASSLI